MEDGYIKLHRKTLDSAIFSNEVALKIWIWCLLKATYKKRSVPVRTGKGETIVELNPGQFIFGREKAGKFLRIPPKTVYNWMSRFEKKFFMIEQKQDTHFTVVTICNWVEYQQSENEIGQPMDNQWTTNGHKQ